MKIIFFIKKIKFKEISSLTFLNYKRVLNTFGKLLFGKVESNRYYFQKN